MRTVNIALREDISGIMNILQENLRANKTQVNETELENKGFLIKAFTEEELEQLIADQKNKTVLVLKEMNEVIGYAIGDDLHHLQPEWLNSVKTSAEIENILSNQKILYHRHIAKKLNRQKVGQPLLEEVLRRALEKKYEYVVCQIMHRPILNRPSVQLHEKLGFKCVGQVHHSTDTAGLYLRRI